MQQGLADTSLHSPSGAATEPGIFPAIETTSRATSNPASRPDSSYRSTLIHLH